MRRTLVSIALLLAACDRRVAPVEQADDHAAANAAMAQDIAGMEDRIRLDAATKRIDALEAKVARLETNPQTIELDLMKQRLEALEAKVYARDADAPPVAASPSPSADASPTPARTRSTTAAAPRTPSAPASSSRPATRSEIDAFGKGGH